MKKITALILALVCVLALSACSGISLPGISYYGEYADASKYSTGDFTYNANEIKEIEINWISGNIEIIQSDAATLSVRESGGTLETEEQMHYYLRAGKLIIHYCGSGYKKNIDASAKNLKIEIPENISIDVDNVSAGVKIGDIKAKDIDISSVSGSVTFADVTADDIDIEMVSGELTMSSVSADNFSADGVSGNIKVSSISASEIDVQIVSGKTELGLTKDCDLEISGVSGSVKIALPAGIGATLEFSTVSGSLSSELEYTKDKQKYTFGTGEIEIDVETVSGNVSVE